MEAEKVSHPDVAVVDEIQWSAEFDILLFLRPESDRSIDSHDANSFDFNFPFVRNA